MFLFIYAAALAERRAHASPRTVPEMRRRAALASTAQSIEAPMTLSETTNSTRRFAPGQSTVLWGNWCVSVHTSAQRET